VGAVAGARTPPCIPTIHLAKGTQQPELGARRDQMRRVGGGDRIWIG
jgi:hypothetical protein